MDKLLLVLKMSNLLLYRLQGVASGDPFAKSVILWTRVTPPSGQKNKPAALDYAVATDRCYLKYLTAHRNAVNGRCAKYTLAVSSRPLLHVTDRKFTKIVSRGTTITNGDVDFTAKVSARLRHHAHVARVQAWLTDQWLADEETLLTCVWIKHRWRRAS